MAIALDLKKGSETKKGFVGFSWTTLFFNFFVPLFRKDWAWTGIMLVTLAVLQFVVPEIIVSASFDIEFIIASGFALTAVKIAVLLVFPFIYNKKYTKKLLDAGWEPAGDSDRAVLKSAGLIAD